MKSYQETPSKSVNCNMDYNMTCIMSWNALNQFKGGVEFSPERLKYNGMACLKCVASRLFQVFPDMLTRFHHPKKMLTSLKTIIDFNFNKNL